MRHLERAKGVAVALTRRKQWKCDTEMPGTKDRAFAKVVLAYAASAGVSRRTAQRHAGSDHPDWKRFTQNTLVGAIAKSPSEPMTPVEVQVLTRASPLAPVPLPASVDRPASELSEPEQILRASWDLWSTHFRMWQECLGGHEKGTGRALERNDVMACAHAGMLIKLRADYDKALAKHTQWQIDERRLIPANEFHAFRSGFLIPLRNMLSNMPAEQASLVNPKDQQQAIKGGQEYLLARLMPQLRQCIDALEQLAPSLAA